MKENSKECLNLKRRFIPDLFLNSVYDMDLEQIKARGFRAFIFDIDNTLVTYDDLIAPNHVKKWFDTLHANGFKTYLISNNNKARVKKFSESLNEKYYYSALKPRKKYLKVACRDMNVKPEETVLVGDQLITDIYGGNRMGMYTIFTKAISDNDHWFVRWKRNIEKFLLKGVDINGS
ncbi:MAG: YqeG family HAD IIIA-type phosphatase [Oscillospiraceae bacterium]